jgi:hypothetical protein
MTRTRTSFLGLLEVLVLLGVPVAWAQQAPVAPVAPVPAQIITAKNVFISNAGVDATSPVDFKRARGPNEPYNHFYIAMKRWGRYELVGTPADADLVLQLRFSAPLSSCETYQPQLTLAVLDTKTHFQLWTFTEMVEDAHRKGAWDKNLKDGIDNLVDDLTQLAGQPAVASR